MLDLSRGVVSSLGQQIALHRAVCQRIIHRQACIPSGNCSKEELQGMHPGSMVLSEGKLIPGGIKCFIMSSMFSVGVAKSKSRYRFAISGSVLGLCNGGIESEGLQGIAGRELVWWLLEGIDSNDEGRARCFSYPKQAALIHDASSLKFLTPQYLYSFALELGFTCNGSLPFRHLVIAAL